MKVRKLLISIIVINLIVILFICIGGFRYLMSEGEAQVIAVNINSNTQKVEIKQDDFVDISKYMPDVEIGLRYATTNNITKTVLYKNAKAYLRKGTADKLKEANDEFKKLGYRIKIWDAYRPTDVQKKLWSKVSDNRYISNPRRGSVHNRGAAVDITLVDKSGNEIPMPTDFDSFSKLADKDYSDVDKGKAENAKLLESVMVHCGFKSVYFEWWHFNDDNWGAYPIVDEVLEKNVNNSYYDSQADSSKTSGNVSIKSQPDFIEKIENGINNINVENIKIEFEYEISKLKSIFGGYEAN